MPEALLVDCLWLGYGLLWGTRYQPCGLLRTTPTPFAATTSPLVPETLVDCSGRTQQVFADGRISQAAVCANPWAPP